MTNTKAKTKEILLSTCSSCEVEVPPAKARWCPSNFVSRFVATKLKYHRLKPGGVPIVFGVGLDAVQHLPLAREESYGRFTISDERFTRCYV